MRNDYTISKPVENPDLVVLSLGAGVQSTALALMAAKGIIKPLPKYMIFADTQYEPKSIYNHLEWLKSEVNIITKGKSKVIKVSSGNLKNDLLKSENSTGQRFASVPFFLNDGGMIRRQCTKEYKIEPINRKIRELCGLKKGQHAPKSLRVEQWIGISCDEMQRLKNNDKKYIINRWPLIEIGFRRHHCIDWFNKHYPSRKLEKSACICCPYRDDVSWLEMKNKDPASFEDACKLDEKIRKGGSMKKIKKDMYMHRSCKPLREVDFKDIESQGELFIEECDGICGV